MSEPSAVAQAWSGHRIVRSEGSEKLATDPGPSLCGRVAFLRRGEASDIINCGDEAATKLMLTSVML